MACQLHNKSRRLDSVHGRKTTSRKRRPASQAGRLPGAIPALELIYRVKQKLCYLLLKKHRTRKRCQPLACRFLRAVQELKDCGFPQLVTLGETLYCWRDEIAAMWRFTKNNGITEGFHTKMEMISRQAFGFRNFDNYRKRVKVLCGGL
jgi:transposase